MSTRSPAKIGEAGYERIDFDNYRTPPWVTETLLGKVAIPAPVWEPAAGDGDMVGVFRARGRRVVTSDIRLVGSEHDGFNFLGDFKQPDWQFASIVTNPPYTFAEQFVRRALQHTSPRGMVAMLLGHDFDTALKTRGDLFNHPAFAFKVMLPKRIQWLNLEKKASPRQIHAWFVWDWMKPANVPPAILYPFPPLINDR